MNAQIRRPLPTLLLLLAAMSHQCAAPAASLEVPRMRLPDQATPLRYSLELTLVPAATEFAGVVHIDLQIKTGTRLLWINGDGLAIEAAAVAAGGVTYSAQARSEPRDFVGLTFEHEIPAGPATLTLRFKGSYAVRETRGLFKQSENGEWYAFTQFEPISARRAFPCFDEPQWKTPWRVTIDAPVADVVASNMPEESSTALEAPAGWRRHVFAASKPLPSYLVALAVGPFDRVSGGRAGAAGTPLGYLAPRGRGPELAAARESTPALLAILEDYFGSAYPYPKLDTVPIPSTLNFGAMENAGMITYR